MRKNRNMWLGVVLSLVLVLSMFMGNVYQPAVVQAKKKVVISKKKYTIYEGKTVVLTLKNSKKKAKWSTSKKSVATVRAKGKTKATVKAVYPGKSTITAKLGSKKYKCKITVKELPLDSRKGTTIENFESYAEGYDWSLYTLGEGLTSGGTEPAHYLSDKESMKVVTDPENPSNKCLRVIPRFYSYAPVFQVDLTKLTGLSEKKLGDYSGIRCKVRVVSDATAHVSKTMGAFFGTTGSIDKRYAFMTYTTLENALPNEKAYYIYHHTKSMASSKVRTNYKNQMPQYDIGNLVHGKGHKFTEEDSAVGFATRTLDFTSYLNDDLKALNAFDFVLGASYDSLGDEEYLAWYIDDVELLS